MVRDITITSFGQVRNIVCAAQGYAGNIGIHDANGSIADAKSILGMMSLDYSRPVKIVCESESALDACLHAIS